MSEVDVERGQGLPHARRELMIRASWYYYQENKTQEQIARLLQVSRPTVSRLLEQARTVGVVRIEVETAAVDLAEQLRERFKLDDIVIVPQARPSPSGQEVNSKVAQAAAVYLQRFLAPDKVIGVGFGDTVLRTMLALPTPRLRGVTLATLTGGVQEYTRHVQGAGLVNLAPYLALVPAPIVASRPEVAQLFLAERAVRGVLDLARSAAATVVGVGAAVPTASILQDEVVTAAHLQQYRRLGAVGDMLSEWYDDEGRIVPGDLHDLRVGLPIQELCTMSNVIGVAAGIDKVAAIRGALAGGYLDVLITTEDVAHAL